MKNYKNKNKKKKEKRENIVSFQGQAKAGAKDEILRASAPPHVYLSVEVCVGHGRDVSLITLCV